MDQIPYCSYPCITSFLGKYLHCVLRAPNKDTSNLPLLPELLGLAACWACPLNALWSYSGFKTQVRMQPTAGPQYICPASQLWDEPMTAFSRWKHRVQRGQWPAQSHTARTRPQDPWLPVQWGSPAGPGCLLTHHSASTKETMCLLRMKLHNPRPFPALKNLFAPSDKRGCQDRHRPAWRFSFLHC